MIGKKKNYSNEAFVILRRHSLCLCIYLHWVIKSVALISYIYMCKHGLNNKRTLIAINILLLFPN
jgi:hypothetical protein